VRIGFAARPGRRDLLSSAGNDQEAFQRVASGGDFSAYSRSAAMAGSPPWGPAARPSSRRRSRSDHAGRLSTSMSTSASGVRSRLMFVRRIRSGRLPGCDHRLPSGPQQASAFVCGSGDRAGEVERVDIRVGAAAGQPVSVRSACWKLARPGPQEWGARSWTRPTTLLLSRSRTRPRHAESACRRRGYADRQVTAHRIGAVRPVVRRRAECCRRQTSALLP
jgi:hypothetical protein